MDEKIILTDHEINLILERLAAQLSEAHSKCRELVLIGIQRRGADLAKRLGKMLARSGCLIETGALDINLYRDDWTALKEGVPIIGHSDIPGDLTDRYVILVDDVLFSGRTVRAALEALLDYGRPKNIELLVLIDRGHRELPIEAGYIGRKLETEPEEKVNVLLEERDGEDKVILQGI